MASGVAEPVVSDMTIKEAPAYFPGRRPNIATVYRFLLREKSALESFRIGGRRFTSVEAIARFIDGCNDQGAVTSASTSRCREREIREAEAELDQAGI